MTLAEFYSWQKFFVLEPPLSERVDLAGALVSSTLANINRGKNKKAFSIEDFMVVKQGVENSVKAEKFTKVDSHLAFVVLALGGRKG